MKLSHLLRKTEYFQITGPGPEAVEIRAVCYDSRQVESGALFVAAPGLRADGHDFIENAMDNGAAAVLVQQEIFNGKTDAQREKIIRTCGNEIPLIGVENARRALAGISAIFHGEPSKDLTLIGVTGTNGKTTVTFLAEHILKAAGLATGVIGTIEWRYGKRRHAAKMTTPEAPELQEMLSEMQGAGVTHVVMEASSHAVELERLFGCRFDIGVFTNLTQDHLDFHRDMETYWGCKRRFFTDLLRKSGRKTAAVVNGDSEKGRELLGLLRGYPEMRTFSAGTDAGNHIRGVLTRHDPSGMAGTIYIPSGHTPSGSFDFTSLLIGDHNLENILCAAGVGVALDIPLEAIRAGIEAADRIPGRLERVLETDERFVYVDYAHTPDALDHVLATLRSLARRRLICVFGCGGDRDRNKRPQMGAIAARHADLAIVTSDNPRSEDPVAIIEEILPGVRSAGTLKEIGERPIRNDSVEDRNLKEISAGYIVIPDRKQAIGRAIAAAAAGDVILIAGKGHETYQILKDRTISFDDRAVAETAMLRTRTGEN